MKKVLLIAGGGTLGSYTAEELLRLGHKVDVICLEDKVSNNENLKFIKADASLEYLEKLFEQNRYNGIVNFLHYDDPEEYKPMHKLLAANTDHLIFLSSYRVYADLEHPITENSPKLLEVSTDPEFLAREDYALSKAKAENFIRNESNTKNWTIVRPVISFSDRRLDIVTVGHWNIIESSKNGRTIFLPQAAKNMTAGLDWAGNSGKLIANLMFKEETLGEAYTISTAQNLTWGEIAELYVELFGVKFEWIDTDEWLCRPDCVKNGYNRDFEICDAEVESKLPEINPDEIEGYYWAAIYDRFFDRQMDSSKVFSATGLTKDDFLSIKEGLKIELDKIKAWRE